MSARPVIDPLDFAHNDGEHHGKIIVSELGRLQDYLVNDGGELMYAVYGVLDRNAKPVLRIAVQGPINLRCQRCLGELRYTLDLRRDLLLTKNEEELRRLDENESVDGVMAIPDMDVLALIEDEIILSLPISPRHAESECSIVKLSGADAAGENPFFSALAQLKKLH